MKPKLRLKLAASAAARRIKRVRHKALIIAAAAAVFAALNVPGIVKTLVYYDDVAEFASAYGVDPMLVISIIYAESRFIPHAESHKGAVGLMQILPPTYRELAGELGLSGKESDLKNPRTNIKVGVYYLSKLSRERWVANDIELLCAYNAGRSKALSWKRASGGRISVEKIPYKETRDYVAKVTRTRRWLKKIIRK